MESGLAFRPETPESVPHLARVDSSNDADTSQPFLVTISSMFEILPILLRLNSNAGLLKVGTIDISG